MNNDLVSIIIPVYNGEKRLKNCLDSLKSQTYKNIEIVIVNDGSQDATSVILEKYDFEDIKHIIINKENEGVSRARNIGIKKSTGKYLCFLDADDTLCSDAIEYMHSLYKDNVDLVRTQYCLEYRNKRVKSNEFLNEKKYYNDEIYEIILKLLLDQIHGFSSLYLIKKEIIIDNKIFFPEKIKYMEDLIFVLKLLENSKCINISNHITLNYYQSTQSVSRSINIDKRFNDIDNRYKFCICYFKKQYKDSLKDFLNMIVGLYLKTIKYIVKKNKKDKKEYCKVMIRNIDKILLDNNLSIYSLSFQNKLFYILVKFNFLILIRIVLNLYSIKMKLKGEILND